MSNPYNNAADKISVLGPTLVFKGELSAEEDLMLRGRVEGSIRHTASLRIGEEGSVKGDIRAKFIAVEGHVEGDLHASASVTVKATADVKGNIYSPSVNLVEGARFKGSIDMDNVEGAVETSPSKSTKAAESNEPKPAPKVAAGTSK